jgi:hypothetical protein
MIAHYGKCDPETFVVAYIFCIDALQGYLSIYWDDALIAFHS